MLFPCCIEIYQSTSLYWWYHHVVPWNITPIRPDNRNATTTQTHLCHLQLQVTSVHSHLQLAVQWGYFPPHVLKTCLVVWWPSHCWDVSLLAPSLRLVGVYGLTGCDTVASYFGIGKIVAVKVLHSRKYSLNCLGETTSSLVDVLSQATSFILACYGQSRCQTLTQARQKVWTSKVALFQPQMKPSRKM
jgi:hypothetical protein